MAGETTVERLTLASVNYLSGRIDVHAYLVRAREVVLLIDTGVGAGNAYIEAHFEPARRSLHDLLAQRDLTLEAVSGVVNSHLHFDHCGNNRLFPDLPVYVQAEEIAAARQPRYTVRDWFDYQGARLVPVAGDRMIYPGITLLATPGHTPGHQSVLVECEDGVTIIAAQAAQAAQAAWTAQEYVRGGDPDAQAHPGLGGAYRESICRLKAVGARRVLFSHDTVEVTDAD